MTSELLNQLFYQMLRIRMLEERIAEVYPQQEMRCPVHLCVGQEAIAVGVCATLSRNDYVMSNHRSHGHYLAKGGDLKALVAELYGKATGCSRGIGGSMHLVDLNVGFMGATPMVASTIPIIVGVALGSVMRGETRVMVTFFGDAAVEEGVFHEAINFASVKKLPVIFICENNLYSVYSPLSVRQPEARKIVDLVRGHKVESWQGDGNDVLEVYKLTAAAVREARQGRGPLFLEFATYRWLEHVGPNYDNHLGYRTETEFLEWRHRDPIARLRKHLLANGIVSEEEIGSMVVQIKTEVEEGFSFAKESAFSGAESLYRHVYAP